jgi:asparagine synthase (glutamine-hydrolysing)
VCGIAGVAALDGCPASADSARAMATALAHRGPDGEGFFEDAPIVLVHRRLAILDLTDAARQPMTDATGRFTIVFNGEIYNHLEIRAELEAAGSRLRSRSDTEVLLEGYARWREGVLPRLNGMFAFAIWDGVERSLFAARDRFGEKPFFYRFVPGKEFRFASEIKALVPPGAGAGKPRRDVLYRFLAFGYAGNVQETFLEGVERIPPAHALTLRDGRLSLRRYWSLPEERRSPEGTEEDAVARVAALVEDAVRIRLRSDVPVGTSLSGGLDSSAVVGTVARLLEAGRAEATTRRATFTASFPGSSVDESRYADAAASAAGAEQHRVQPGGDECLRDLPRLVEAQEEPFTGPSVYAQWRVMGLARDCGVTVLLDGQGADEIFAGYHFFFQDFWWNLLRSGRLSTLRSEMRSYDADHGGGRARRLLQAGVRARSPRWLSRLKGGPHLPWLSGGFVREHRATLSARPSDLRGSLRECQATRMLPHLLRYADRNSMAFSREVRLPFLDHRLAEAVDDLPDHMKLRGGTTKWVLREAIRGVVPEEVRTRKDKIGFAVPFPEWMRGPLDAVVREVLESHRFRERGFFDVAYLRGARERLFAGEDRWADVLWSALSVELWMRAFVDGPGGRG